MTDRETGTVTLLVAVVGRMIKRSVIYLGICMQYLKRERFEAELEARSVNVSDILEGVGGEKYWVSQDDEFVYFGLTIDGQSLMFASKGGDTFWQALASSNQVMAVDETWIEKGRGTLHEALEELAEKFKKEMAYSVKPQHGSTCLSVQFC